MSYFLRQYYYILIFLDCQLFFLRKSKIFILTFRDFKNILCLGGEYMAFKDRLKEAREQAGLNQTELAELLGNVTNKTISSYENGNSFPKTEILYKMFDVLHTTPNFLFQDVVNTPRKTKEELTLQEFEFIKKYRKLDNISKDIVNYIVDAEINRANSQIK